VRLRFLGSGCERTDHAHLRFTAARHGATVKGAVARTTLRGIDLPVGEKAPAGVRTARTSLCGVFFTEVFLPGR
jgi:hypothetical protein